MHDFLSQKKEKSNKKLTVWQNREKAGNGVGIFLIVLSAIFLCLFLKSHIELRKKNLFLAEKFPPAVPVPFLSLVGAEGTLISCGGHGNVSANGKIYQSLGESISAKDVSLWGGGVVLLHRSLAGRVQVCV